MTPAGNRESIAADDALAPMREAWDGFAERDAMFYIQCERTQWTREEFFADGRGHFAAVLEWVGTLVEHGSMLDLGCGLGRITVAAAPHFDSVVGADISARMLDEARSLDPPENVSFVHITTADLRELGDETFDFAGCFSVFQHIPDEGVIAAYLAAIGRVLRPGGRALLHFNTAPESRFRRMALALPDWLLPRKNRRFMRRSRRDAGRIRELIAGAGLTIEEERNPESVLHHLLARRPGRETD